MNNEMYSEYVLHPDRIMTPFSKCPQYYYEVRSSSMTTGILCHAAISTSSPEFAGAGIGVRHRSIGSFWSVLARIGPAAGGEQEGEKRPVHGTGALRFFPRFHVCRGPANETPEAAMDHRGQEADSGRMPADQT